MRDEENPTKTGQSREQMFLQCGAERSWKPVDVGQEAEDRVDIFDYFPWIISRNRVCLTLEPSGDTVCCNCPTIMQMAVRILVHVD